MDKFKWEDEYCIGLELVDNDHKKLFSLANNTWELAKKGEDLQKVRDAVTALYDYVQYHFSHEEEFMKQLDYNKLSEHKKLHSETLHKMNMIMHNTKDIDMVVYKFKRLIVSWVLEHLLTEDMKIKEFSERKSAKEAQKEAHAKT